MQVEDKVSFERFLDARGRFQHMMGDRNLTTEQVQRAFAGLCWLLLHLAGTTTEKQKQRAAVCLESAAIEWSMRQAIGARR